MLVRWHRLLVLFLAARRPGPWSAKPNCESDGSSAARGSTWGSRRCTWRVGRSERSCGYWGRWKTARRLAPWAIREPRPSVAALPYRERDHNFHEYRWFTWISMISRKNGYHLQFRWGIQKKLVAFSVSEVIRKFPFSGFFYESEKRASSIFKISLSSKTVNSWIKSNILKKANIHTLSYRLRSWSSRNRNQPRS